MILSSACLTVSRPQTVAFIVGIYTVVFHEGHFLFTSSDNVAVGCIIYSKNTAID